MGWGHVNISPIKRIINDNEKYSYLVSGKKQVENFLYIMMQL